jgi:hypothetical protein
MARLIFTGTAAMASRISILSSLRNPRALRPRSQSREGFSQIGVETSQLHQRSSFWVIVGVIACLRQLPVPHSWFILERLLGMGIPTLRSRLHPNEAPRCALCSDKRGLCRSSLTLVREIEKRLPLLHTSLFRRQSRLSETDSSDRCRERRQHRATAVASPSLPKPSEFYRLQRRVCGLR